jgi:outer membrane protein OmpA-like peptidoglycan-associated protein
MKMPKHILTCLLFLSSCFCLAQTHEGNNDCTYGKEIIIPFNYTENGAVKTKHNLNQTMFYNYRDQFSFWYKIVVKDNATLSFKIKPINDSDEYAVYVYQYNEKDFCDKVYYQKVRSVKPSFFAGNVSKEDPYSLNEKSFSAKKDNVYYISVLNTSLNNCGHSFYLVHEKDTLKVKAIHLPCKRDLTALSAKKTPLPKKPDTVSVKINIPAVVKKDSIKKDSIQPVVSVFKKLKEGDHLIMKSIYFYPNTCALKKSSSTELQKLLTYLLANDTMRIEIQGHTNGDHRIAKNKSYATLNEEWNYEGSSKTLSFKRAETIKKYLETNGIKPERLEAKGYGGKKPIVKDPQTNEEGALNIRVELVILKR